jgi:hypothetical protein
MAKGHGWYFIAIVRQHGNTVDVVQLNQDAVFAESGPDAMRVAATRNPLRPGQEFATTKASAYNKAKAIRVNEDRTREIAELAEILESRCGLAPGS